MVQFSIILNPLPVTVELFLTALVTIVPDSSENNKKTPTLTKSCEKTALRKLGLLSGMSP